MTSRPSAALGASTRTSAVSLSLCTPASRRQRRGERAGLVVDVIDDLALGRVAVAEGPAVVLDARERPRATAVEADGLAGDRDEVVARVGSQRLREDDRDGRVTTCDT